jgi:superfamily II DNA/RNA helicase
MSHKNRFYHPDTPLAPSNINQLIIFTATREDAARLALLCEQLGHSAVGLSGKLSQSSRNAVMLAFATGKHLLFLASVNLSSCFFTLSNILVLRYFCIHESEVKI